MNIAYIILGSNIGNRLEYLNKSIEMISAQIGEVINKSSVYESEPWGFEASLNFYNQVIEIKTNLLPHDLLNTLLKIELELGRERKEGGYASRTIDLDILFYNEECINESELIIPHPRLHKRIFTLEPLCEIASELVHPVFKKSCESLLDECEDKSILKKLD